MLFDSLQQIQNKPKLRACILPMNQRTFHEERANCEISKRGRLNKTPADEGLFEPGYL